MPKSYVRLSAGRDSMNDQMQALCFFAGANSIFYGEELLTTKNSTIQHDQALLKKLKIKTKVPITEEKDKNSNNSNENKLKDIPVSVKDLHKPLAS